MKFLVSILFFALFGEAQTTVYLRSSAPAAVPVCGASAATPVVVQTCAPHNYSTGNIVVIDGVCSGAGYASPINGIRTATVVDSTHFSIADLSGNPIVSNGAYVPACGGAQGSASGAQWTGLLTPYVLGAEPLGWFDGPSGTIMRKLALSTSNGLSGLTVSGCPAACVVTVSTSYDPTVGTLPVAAGDKFSVIGTTSSGLNTKIFAAGAPYTIASVSSTGWSSQPAALSGVSNGSYTYNNACGPAATPNDTIGGTQNCVRISRLAYAGNPFWDAVRQDSNNGLSMDSGNSYKFVADGGSIYIQPQMQWFTLGALQFLVDPTNSQYLAVTTYALNHVERAGGVNWTGNELYSQGGTVDLNQYAGSTYAAMAFIYLVGGAYLNPAEKSAFLDKMYNDLDDPSKLCNKTDTNMASGHNDVIATGAAQGGSGNTIILAASDSQPDAFYVNTTILATVNGSNYYCLVSAYVSATKAATCVAPLGQAPSNGTPYQVFGTVTISSTKAGGAATIMGYRTRFTSNIHIGDAILAANGWDTNFIRTISYVTAVNSDTSLSVINGLSVDASTTTPAIAWYISQWRAGDCGLSWLAKHWVGAMGAQPNLYPYGGGNLTDNVPGGVADGGNNGNEWTTGHMLMGFAAAPDDARAVRDLAFYQSYAWDYELRHYWNYVTGLAHSGSVYNSETVLGPIQQTSLILSMSLPDFPDMNLAGQWNQNIALFRMFQVYPDWRYSPTYSTNTGWPVKEGSENGDNEVGFRVGSSNAYLGDLNFFMNPTAQPTKYLRCWLDSACNPNLSTSLWGFWGIVPQYEVGMLLYNDPRLPSSDFRAQPHQYLFQATNRATCASLTGWPCPSDFRADAVISRTGFASKTDTHLYFGSRVYWNDHDVPQNGILSVYKVGELLGSDFKAPNDTTEGLTDETVVADMFQFGGASSAPGGNGVGVYGPSPIVRWASGNHGSWNAAYGDQDSQYSYWCSDLRGAYKTPITYFLRCEFHMKPTAGEEIIAQLDTIATPAATQMVGHVHYPENGETGVSAYAEGHTVCPGSGGCGALNINRQVQSLETGIPDGTNDPTPNFGVLSTWLSPDTISVNWDCPAGVECTTASTYKGGNGHSDRVSVCGGASCGSAVTSYNVMTVHKIAQSLTDTSLTATALKPDGNWFGVQTKDKVILGALGGTTQTAITGFQTTHTGSAQYIFGGLVPGTYTVTVDGNAVAGSPFTVSANDNSLEFVSTAGTVRVSAGGQSATAGSSTVSGQAAIGGNAVIR